MEPRRERSSLPSDPEQGDFYNNSLNPYKPSSYTFLKVLSLDY